MTTNTAGNLSARAVLVSLNIRTWSGCRQDKTIVQAASDKTSASKSALRGSKYIVPPSDLKPINTIASYLRTEHYRLTLPWIEEGWRMLEVAAFPRHRKLVKDSESAFRSAVSDFLTIYPSRICKDPERCNTNRVLQADGTWYYGHSCEPHARLGTLYDPSQMPDPASLAAAYGVTVRTIPMPDARDFRVALGADDAAVRADLDSAQAEASAAARQEVRDRILAVVGGMAGKLRSYTGGREGAFRDSLIENVRELVDVLPLLNITDDPAVNAVLAGLDSIGRVDPSDLRKDAALREQLAREAETLTSAMEAFA